MPLYFNPFSGNIEFKPTGGGGGGGITGSGFAGQVTIWNSPTSITGDFDLIFDTANKRLGIATLNPVSKLNVVDSIIGPVRGTVLDQYNIGSEGSRLFLRKSRGAPGLPSIINSGDTLGEILFSGYDSLDFLTSGNIRVAATGVVLGTRVPSIMEFKTSTNATPSVLLTALTLTETQKATFANTVELGMVSIFDLTYKPVIEVTSNLALRIGGNGISFSSIDLPGVLTSTNVLMGRFIADRANIISNVADTQTAVIRGGFVVTNSTNGFTGLLLDTRFNQVGTGVGIMTVLDINPLVTRITSSLFGLRLRISSAAAGTGGGLVWNIYADGTANNLFNGLCKFGGVSVPTAWIELNNGSPTIAPLKFNSGSILGTPQVGAFEFQSDNYFITGQTGPTRKVIRDLSYSAISVGTVLDGRHEFIDCTAGTFAVTLPTAVGYLKQFTIFNSGVGVITINTTGGQTINGAASGTFTLVQFDCIILRSNGVNWYKIN